MFPVGRMGWTYTGNAITNTTIINMIKCSHQKRLKCALILAPKPALVGDETAPTSSMPDLSLDMMVVVSWSRGLD